MGTTQSREQNILGAVNAGVIVGVQEGVKEVTKQVVKKQPSKQVNLILILFYCNYIKIYQSFKYNMQ